MIWLAQLMGSVSPGLRDRCRGKAPTAIIRNIAP